MALQKLPVRSLDTEERRRLVAERINGILDHGFDDSRTRTNNEVQAGIFPTNPAYPPGHFHRYGAVGDGVTDDSAAIQRAFNSGGHVQAISGNTYYTGTATISVPAGSRATLYGIRLKSVVDEATFLDVVGDDVEILGVEIEGQGNGSTTTSDEVLVRFSGASAAAYLSGLLLKDCYIHDSGFYGVFSQFGRDVTITNCYFDDIAYTAVMVLSGVNWNVSNNQISDITPGSAGNAYGISFNRDGSSTGTATFPRCTDCQANNNIVQNITDWEALDTHGGERITFANNVIINCLYGINVSPISAANLAPLDVTITGNVISSGTESSDPGRAIGSGGVDSSNKSRNITVSGNVVRGYGPDSNSDGAIMFQYVDGLIITGNVIEDSRASGICVLIDNDQFVLSGNAIRGIRNGVANAAGINIRQGSQTGYVGDNFIAATAEIGIFIASSSTGVEFGRNVITTSGSRYTDAINAGRGLEITGTTTTDVASIANGAQAQFNITVTGAELGDECSVTCSISTAALSLTGTVTATNTVTAVLQNNTGGAVDLANATYTAVVRKL